MTVGGAQKRGGGLRHAECQMGGVVGKYFPFGSAFSSSDLELDEWV